jgi:hypothetical protein
MLPVPAYRKVCIALLAFVVVLLAVYISYVHSPMCVNYARLFMYPLRVNQQATFSCKML